MYDPCSLCLRVSHDNARYMWRSGYKGRQEHCNVLCVACAKNVGAWKLPEKKKEEVEEEEPNYHGEDEEVFDDTPQPNNNLSGNPYR